MPKLPSWKRLPHIEQNIERTREKKENEKYKRL